jgi:hypothetical protein
MCDTTAGSAKAGEAALRAVLPPLLEKGLVSTVAEVKAVAIGTLMKLTRSAGGALLAPQLGVLVPALLEATSEMEGTQLSYISTRLGVDNSVQVRRRYCSLLDSLLGNNLCSVVGSGCLSRILIFTHPGSRIQKQKQKRGVKKNLLLYLFM